MMLIRLGKWHIVFITKNEHNPELWDEKWFSLFPPRFNQKYSVQIKRRLGMKLKKGTLMGESIFPPLYSHTVKKTNELRGLDRSDGGNAIQKEAVQRGLKSPALAKKQKKVKT